MLIPIAPGVVLQSARFALTNAEEHLERMLTDHTKALVQHVIVDGDTVSEKFQGKLHEEYTALLRNVEVVKNIIALCEYHGDEPVMVDAETFELLRPNLPPR